jgi:DNA-binding beta-propeller fold protein YncE
MSFPVNASPHLYVANESSDTCNGGGDVSVFDLANPANAPMTITCGGLISPLGVAVDASGKLYVTNNALQPGNTINVFDTTHGDAVLAPITGPGLHGSQGVAVDDA